jgi:hypothetical protein
MTRPQQHMPRDIARLVAEVRAAERSVLGDPRRDGPAFARLVDALGRLARAVDAHPDRERLVRLAIRALG